ncbi:hypothetical protein GCM10010104_15360 [Streptomyces indiaensis]|uniref:Uncharacterized protein n=1 Tax=Streptomyces indiaensis TaxID=284033 RepID=A0ABN3D989_9ACTN
MEDGAGEAVADEADAEGRAGGCAEGCASHALHFRNAVAKVQAPGTMGAWTGRTTVRAEWAACAGRQTRERPERVGQARVVSQRVGATCRGPERMGWASRGSARVGQARVRSVPVGQGAAG